MNKTPNFDLKIKSILDATQPGKRICELTGEKWMMDEEEIGWYKKFNVPPSHRAPLTRMQAMTSFWLAYQWWWNEHAETGKPLLTFIHPGTGLRVLPDKEWFERDYLSVGRSYDPEQSFFSQLRELQLQVPMLADRNSKEPHNSIAKFSLGDVNSYFMMFGQSKDSLYSFWAFDIEDCSEVWNSTNVSKSYRIADSRRIHNSKFVRASFDCLNSAFLFDCRNCEFCFGATNKRNEKYLWFNKQLSKEEWERRMATVDFSSHSAIRPHHEQFAVLMREAIWPENFNEQTEESSGEYLTRVSRVKHGYICLDGTHDCYWVGAVQGNSYDCAFTAGAFNTNRSFGGIINDQSSNMLFSYSCGDCQNMEYSMQCFNCENCFGCVGLNRKKFCIFNVEYSENEYWKRVDELKCAMLDRGEYGETFPVSMTPAYFPDSGCVFYYGIDPEEGKKIFGALDFDPESFGAIGTALTDVINLKNTNEIPDSIDAMNSEEWVGVPLYDPIMKRRFAYIRPELEYYKRHCLAPPKRHFIARMQALSLGSNSGKSFETECHSCHISITTAENMTYQNRIIYCKPCYLQYLEKNG